MHCICPLMTQSGHRPPLFQCWFKSLRYPLLSSGAAIDGTKQAAKPEKSGAPVHQRLHVVAKQASSFAANATRRLRERPQRLRYCTSSVPRPPKLSWFSMLCWRMPLASVRPHSGIYCCAKDRSFVQLLSIAGKATSIYGAIPSSMCGTIQVPRSNVSTILNRLSISLTFGTTSPTSREMSALFLSSRPGAHGLS